MPHTIRFFSLLFFASLLGLFGCSQAKRATPISKQPSIQSTSTQVAANYGQVPLSFEANHGQAKEPVKFLARGTNAALYLTPTEAALEVRHTAEKTALVKMKLLGANANPMLQGQGELPGKSNYFSGKEASLWKTNIPTYQQVRYEQVYEGIDLVYYGNQQQLEYDFIVQPGADPDAIKLRFEGTEAIALNEAGELVLQTTAGEVKQHKPVVYQEVNGEKKEIAGTYVLEAGQVGFQVGAYDRTKDLVIDPVIVYATYLGGATGGAVAITADREGQAYVAMNYGPAATSGAYQNGSGFSVFKLNKAGTAILYSATLGGSEFDRVVAMTVDAQGNCYLTGQAVSSAFPTTPGAFQSDMGITCGGCLSAFVTKINATGSSLAYSTFLKGDNTSGTKSNRGQGIAVDGQGNAYVTGYTNAKDFPTTAGAFQPNLNVDEEPARDIFITKVNPNGTGLVYSTYFGAGDNIDQGRDIAVDTAGNIYVIGSTGNGYGSLSTTVQKTPFPVTSGAYQCPADISRGGLFVSKFNATGSTLIYSTLLKWSATSTDLAKIVVDANGNAYITGHNRAPDFPTTPGAFKTTFTSQVGHAFVTKVNALGSDLIYSTFVGGSIMDTSLGIGIDAEGNATIAGQTGSPDFPQTGPPVSISQGGSFVTKLNATGRALLYSQYTDSVFSRSIAVDGLGDVYLQGNARNSFQPTPDAYQSTLGSTSLTKIRVPKSATTVSAANYSGSPLASEAIVSAFGTGLATSTQSAASLPLPTTLGGTTIKVRDSIGTEREAALFFASPTQMNFQIPPGTANGNATITITAQDGASFLSNVEIANVVPSLFSADATGRGIAAAHVQRGGSLAFEQVVKFDPFKGQFVALPIDLGPATDQVYLILYGTGIRLCSNLNNVTATIGGTPATVSYAGAQNDFVGLDQVNVLIPRSLIGRGMVDVVLNVEDKPANTVKVSIK